MTRPEASAKYSPSPWRIQKAGTFSVTPMRSRLGNSRRTDTDSIHGLADSFCSTSPTFMSRQFRPRDTPAFSRMSPRVSRSMPVTEISLSSK